MGTECEFICCDCGTPATDVYIHAWRQGYHRYISQHCTECGHIVGLTAKRDTGQERVSEIVDISPAPHEREVN